MKFLNSREVENIPILSYTMAIMAFAFVSGHVTEMKPGMYSYVPVLLVGRASFWPGTTS